MTDRPVSLTPPPAGYADRRSLLNMSNSLLGK